ncbi:hypothetical protein APHAL10511_003934 [Amanita phalloides]|nr:hypothetical protein APHAL10511_003934 [Amanita phalloides]
MPIQDPKIVEMVLGWLLQETQITLSFEELLSLSPDIRYRICDQITPKRQAVKNGSLVVEEEEDPMNFNNQLAATQIAPGQYQIPDLPQVFYSMQKNCHSERSIVLQSQKESLASQAISMKIAGKADIKCILDPRSEIVCMSDAVCNQLGIPYDPMITIRMQSANGECDETLSLVQDVSFEIGDFVLLFQVHVVKSSAYNILLGQPFDDLVNTKVENLSNEEQLCMITDPMTGQAFTIPMFEHSPARFTMIR